MSLITSFSDGKSATRGLGSVVVKQEIEIDTSVTNVGVGDTVTCLNIPKGAAVLRVGCVVSTVEGTAATMSVSDGDSVGGWLPVVDLNALATTMSTPLSGYSLAGGKCYTSAADTIDFVAGAALDAAVFTVWAEYSVLESVANA